MATDDQLRLERELREIKGHCSWMACRLHFAHSGPCDIPAEVTP